MGFEDDLKKNQCRSDSVISIGVFDGVHLGHQYLFEALKATANLNQIKSGILTFINHPASILNPAFKQQLIDSPKDKIVKLRKTGVDFVIPIHFNTALSTLTAIQFIRLLQKHLNMAGLVVGPDFHMGAKREADVQVLQHLSDQMGFFMAVPSAYEKSTMPVRSTTIRQLILEGNIKKAKILLGVNYMISGKVITGYKRGSELGYPTANLQIDLNRIVPANGIYATKITINSQTYNGATSIGSNPTFNNKALSIETFILDFNENIYHKNIEVEFIDKIRDQITFTSTESLIAQMNKDVIKIRELLNN